MKKELSKVYKEIMDLTKTIDGILKGEEPNMQALLGVSEEDKQEEEEGENIEEIKVEGLETLRVSINTMRKNVCDYYAEKYSNECNVQ